MSKFKYEIGQNLKDNNRDITIIDRKYQKDKNGRIRKYYKYICNKCNFNCGNHYSVKNKEYKDELWIQESNLNTQGCACCRISPTIIVEGINDINKTSPWIIEYLKNKEDALKYLCNSNENIWCICPECGEEKLMTLNNLFNQGFSCLKCGDGISYPNKLGINLFETLQIDFEREFSPEWIKPRAYDFYIPSKNIIIEMDGGLGHGKHKHSKSKVSIEESKAIDDYKDEQARLHGIEVIRIDCDYKHINIRFKYIKDNIINHLKNIFNLNDINWNEIAINSDKSLLKIICDKWNKKISIIDICKEYKLSEPTIRYYLKRGDLLSLTLYNPKEEMRKSMLKCNKLKEMAVICIETKEIFDSAMQIEKMCLDKFGVKMTHRSISNCCNGKQIKSYKGYNFRFYDTKSDKILYLENDKLLKVI